MNYLDYLPEELCCKIHQYYLVNLIESEDFSKKSREFKLKFLQKNLSRKQLEHLGLHFVNLINTSMTRS